MNETPKFEILTTKSVYGEISDNEWDTYLEDLAKEQDETLENLGYKPWGTDYTIHFFNSPYTNDLFDVDTIPCAIERLAIKDGVDLVRFETGNIGFVAYYNGNKNGFEILSK